MGLSYTLYYFGVYDTPLTSLSHVITATGMIQVQLTLLSLFCYVNFMSLFGAYVEYWRQGQISCLFTWHTCVVSDCYQRQYLTNHFVFSGHGWLSGFMLFFQLRLLSVKQFPFFKNYLHLKLVGCHLAVLITLKKWKILVIVSHDDM